MKITNSVAIFSDLDGTFCFQDKIHGIERLRTASDSDPGDSIVKQPGRDSEVFALDWGRGSIGVYVDIATLIRIRVLQRLGLPLIPVTGARANTMIPRFHSMPFIEGAVIENGGRIVDREMNDNQEWEDHLSAQVAALKTMEKYLESQGIKMDNKGRKAMIRIRLQDNPHMTKEMFDLFFR